MRVRCQLRAKSVAVEDLRFRIVGLGFKAQAVLGVEGFGLRPYIASKDSGAKARYRQAPLLMADPSRPISTDSRILHIEVVQHGFTGPSPFVTNTFKGKGEKGVHECCLVLVWKDLTSLHQALL